jgi:hypothetical protein
LPQVFHSITGPRTANERQHISATRKLVMFGVFARQLVLLD